MVEAEGRMGLFDKKKKGGDDFDSPVEEISLAAKPSSGASPGPGGKPTDTVPGTLTAVGAKKPAPPPEPEPDLHFNIDKAIELMRQLPQDNVELVVRVVKTTLESMRIKVSAIIDDATRKQQHIEQRIAGRKKEIADLESEISVRKQEISALEADHAETTMVKDRLVLSEKQAGAAAPKPAAAAASRP
jgi:hypothetical protein